MKDGRLKIGRKRMEYDKYLVNGVEEEGKN
jgi:hypothetical protein